MELMPWRSRPMSPLSGLQSEMNRMFDDFLSYQPSDWWPLRDTRARVVVPALEAREDENDVVVTAELPGVNSEDIDISVKEDVLELRGQKRRPKREDEDNDDYYIEERCYGAFCRQIRLPAEVDSEHADASMNNGVLTLRLPKLGPKKGKQAIEIRDVGQPAKVGPAGDSSTIPPG